jgi:hypothetical protein
VLRTGHPKELDDSNLDVLLKLQQVPIETFGIHWTQLIEVLVLVVVIKS